MNPAQQYFPSPEELHLLAVEQALVDFKAREIETQAKLETILNGFKHIEQLILEQQPPPTPPKIPSTNIIPVWSAPTG